MSASAAPPAAADSATQEDAGQRADHRLNETAPARRQQIDVFGDRLELDRLELRADRVADLADRPRAVDEVGDLIGHVVAVRQPAIAIERGAAAALLPQPVAARASGPFTAGLRTGTRASADGRDPHVRARRPRPSGSNVARASPCPRRATPHRRSTEPRDRVEPQEPCQRDCSRRCSRSTPCATMFAASAAWRAVRRQRRRAPAVLRRAARARRRRSARSSDAPWSGIVAR